jgi:hypothetical protein
VRKTEYKAYQETVGKNKLLVIGANDGLNAAREAVRQTLKKNEWAMHMDDNVRWFVTPQPEFYRKNEEIAPGPGEPMITRKRWSAKMNIKVDFKAFYDLCVEDSLNVAASRGAHLVGFSPFDNPAFRERKYVDVGYVCGKVMLMHNVGLPWIQSRESSGEDYALTAAHLYDNGRVLINKWGHPWRYHYQPGGCGPYEERLPSMLLAQKDLIARYGRLFGVKNEHNPDRRQGELRMRMHSLAQIESWRASLAKDPNYRVDTDGKLRRPKVTK